MIHVKDGNSAYIILEDANLWVGEYKRLHSLHQNQPPSPPSPVHWCPPNFGTLKANVDAALSKDGNFIGIRVIIRDYLEAVRGALYLVDYLELFLCF
ncbi:hypothetical protein PanWU01x14_270040 [Parasponia andersonii]|uniref:RNase H type-1 domain-containing protein n=1 Tax=Parasponia andersonii TaxID=3476 RepID=A0A2P5B592_PARAD|nr:hypothetical protein PanWU01x14_270040 [Parasponia andersonii]